MVVPSRRQNSLGCEAGSNLTIGDGSVFGIACNAAYFADGPAQSVSFTSIDDCIQDCTDPSCIAVFGDPDHCYLLSGLSGYASAEPSVGAFAVLNIQPAQGRRNPPLVSSPTVTTFSTLPTPSTLVDDLGNTLGCEAGSNLTIGDGSVFGIACNAAYFATGPAQSVPFTSIDDCIQDCTDPSCIAVFGDPDHCYLLSGLSGYASAEPSVGAFAVLNIQPAQGRRNPPQVSSPTVTTFSTLPTPSTLVDDLGSSGQASTTPPTSLSSTAISAPTGQGGGNDGLSTGAKAGIGVGAAIIGLAVILGIAYLSFRIGKKSRGSVTQQPLQSETKISEQAIAAKNPASEITAIRTPAELHSDHRPHEAAGRQLFEVEGEGLR